MVMVLPNQHKLAEQCTTDSLQTIYSLFFYLFGTTKNVYIEKYIYTTKKGPLYCRSGCVGGTVTVVLSRPWLLWLGRKPAAASSR